jgi:hypothetical protein
LPALAIGGELELSLRVWRVALEASVAQFASVAARSDEGASFLLFDASAGACFLAIDTLRWSVGPCAKGGAEWIFASGYGSKYPSDATADIAVAAFGLRAGVMLTSRLSLDAAVDAVVPLSRPFFFIDDGGVSDVVFHLPTAAARGSMGLQFHF